MLFWSVYRPQGISAKCCTSSTTLRVELHVTPRPAPPRVCTQRAHAVTTATASAAAWFRGPWRGRGSAGGGARGFGGRRGQAGKQAAVRPRRRAGTAARTKDRGATRGGDNSGVREDTRRRGGTTTPESDARTPPGTSSGGRRPTTARVRPEGQFTSLGGAENFGEDLSHQNKYLMSGSPRTYPAKPPKSPAGAAGANKDFLQPDSITATKSSGGAGSQHR
ncbi:hypothetical protein R5R35_009346 [Gryllus longicercus]|uniref:Uncharacterized protein n=1 Tax=Gryllus longicercus TaxID=2509291 RepID=A0AAN9VH81_9ORTH